MLEYQAKTVVIFAGRFQPFHRGHYLSYLSLVQQFPEADVWIATSGKVCENSPFDFHERKSLAVLAGIPANRVAAVKNPYVADEILGNYDRTKDKVIFVLGAKDSGRLNAGGFKKDGSPNYFQPFENLESMTCFDRETGHGYVMVAPLVEFSVAGKSVVGATSIRAMLAEGSPELSSKVLVDLYGESHAETARQIISKHFVVC